MTHMSECVYAPAMEAVREIARRGGLGERAVRRPLRDALQARGTKLLGRLLRKPNADPMIYGVFMPGGALPIRPDKGRVGRPCAKPDRLDRRPQPGPRVTVVAGLLEGVKRL